MCAKIFNPQSFNNAAIIQVETFSIELLTLDHSYTVKLGRIAKTKFGPRPVLRIELPPWETVQQLKDKRTAATIAAAAAAVAAPETTPILRYRHQQLNEASAAEAVAEAAAQTSSLGADKSAEMSALSVAGEEIISNMESGDGAGDDKEVIDIFLHR